jgi:hypothetical protein
MPGEGSATTLLPPLNFLLANFAISNQRIDARLRQPLPGTVHAQAESFCFNPVLTTMPLVVIGASLLHRFAVGMLSNGDAAPNGETKDGNEQTTKELHGRSSFMAMA